MAEADRMHLLDPIARSARYKSFHLVIPGREVKSGAAALPDLLGLLLAGKFTTRALHSVPFSLNMIASVYGVLSRVHESGSCNTTLGNS